VQELLKEVKKEQKRNNSSKEAKKNWLQRIQNWKKVYPIYGKSSFDENDSTLSPQDAIYHIGKEYSSSTFTTDVGQHQMWSAQLVNTHPKNWASSSGLGTMGFGLPAALGAQVAKNQKETICITGDSSFQMSIQELGTISQYKLNTKIFIINNHWQGMVRQWQESFYGNRFSNSYMKNGMPNFLEIAKAYSINGKIISTKKDLIQTLKEIKDSKEPYLIEILVNEQENCYPMVIPGRNNSHMFGIKK
jgi:acetolactate synthase-1/2/3 large subunit